MSEWTEVGTVDFEDETGIVISQQGDEVRLAFYAEDLGYDGFTIDLQPWAREVFQRVYMEAERQAEAHEARRA